MNQELHLQCSQSKQNISILSIIITLLSKTYFQMWSDATFCHFPETLIFYLDSRTQF